MSKIEYDSFVCYQCEANEVSAPVGSVHVLCEPCVEEHNDWFMRQLAMFKERNS
jgi:hypothetical protein